MHKICQTENTYLFKSERQAGIKGGVQGWPGIGGVGRGGYGVAEQLFNFVLYAFHLHRFARRFSTIFMVAHLSHNDNVCFGSFTFCPPRRSLSATTPWRDTSANRGSYYSNSYLYIVMYSLCRIHPVTVRESLVIGTQHWRVSTRMWPHYQCVILVVATATYVCTSQLALLPFCRDFRRWSEETAQKIAEIGYSFFYNLSCLQCTEVDIIYAYIFLISIRKVEPAMFLCVSLSSSIVAIRPKASFTIYNISQANKPFFSYTQYAKS